MSWMQRPLACRPPERRCLHTPRIGDAGCALSPPVASFGDFRGQTGTGCFWIECTLQRTASNPLKPIHNFCNGSPGNRDRFSREPFHLLCGSAGEPPPSARNSCDLGRRPSDDPGPRSGGRPDQGRGAARAPSRPGDRFPFPVHPAPPAAAWTGSRPPATGGPSGAFGRRIGALRGPAAVSRSSHGPPEIAPIPCRSAPETGHGVELRAACPGNHPRTQRERRHRALKTRGLPSAHGKTFGAKATNAYTCLPRFAATGRCRSPDVSGLVDGAAGS